MIKYCDFFLCNVHEQAVCYKERQIPLEYDVGKRDNVSVMVRLLQKQGSSYLKHGLRRMVHGHLIISFVSNISRRFSLWRGKVFKCHL